jgi:hypothetical protein
MAAVMTVDNYCDKCEYIIAYSNLPEFEHINYLPYYIKGLILPYVSIDYLPLNILSLTIYRITGSLNVSNCPPAITNYSPDASHIHTCANPIYGIHTLKRLGPNHIPLTFYESCVIIIGAGFRPYFTIALPNTLKFTVAS